MTSRSETQSPTRSTGAEPGKDASQLLKIGTCLLLAGIGATVLTETALGGIGIHGARSSSGWLMLVLALACLPLGAMVFLLGGAKWLSRRRH